MRAFVTLLMATLLTLQPVPTLWTQEESSIVETSLPVGTETPAEEPTPEEIPQVGEDQEELLEDAVSVQRVIVPTQFQFVIDPYEIREKGQIFSSPFCVENRGDEPTIVYLRDIHCNVKGDAISFVTERIDPLTESTEKEIQLIFRRIDLNEPTGISDEEEEAEGEAFTLDDEEESGQTITAVSTGPTMEIGDRQYLSTTPIDSICFILEGGETAAFELTGTVNANAEEAWRAGDVQLKMNFEVVPLSQRQERTHRVSKTEEEKPTGDVSESVPDTQPPDGEGSSSTPDTQPPEGEGSSSVPDAQPPDGEGSSSVPDTQPSDGEGSSSVPDTQPPDGEGSSSTPDSQPPDGEKSSSSAESEPAAESESSASAEPSSASDQS